MDDQQIPGSSSFKENNFEGFFSMPEKSIQDKKYTAILMILFIGAGLIDAYSFLYGEPLKFLNTFDSWGNVCGRRNNSKIPGVHLSGMDMRNKKFVLNFGINNIQAGFYPTTFFYLSNHPGRICVHQCPRSEVTNCRELLKENGYINIPERNITQNICVMLLDAIFPQRTELNRCIPKQLLQMLENTTAAPLKTTWDLAHSLENAETETNYDIKKYFPIDSRVITSRFFKLAWIWCIVPLFWCIFLLVTITSCPKSTIFFVTVTFILSSVIFTLQLIFVIHLANQFSKENQLLPAIKLDVKARPNLQKYVVNTFGSKTYPTFFLENDTRHMVNSLTGFNIQTYNTTELFSYYTLEGPPIPSVLICTILVITFITWVNLAFLFRNQKKFFSVMIFLNKIHTLVSRMPFLYLHSLLMFIILILIFVYLTTVIKFLLTIEIPRVDEQGFVEFYVSNSTVIVILIVLHTLFCVWLWQFVVTCGQYVSAHVTFTYLYHRRRHGPDSSPNSFQVTCKPLADLLKYNVGTITVASVALPFCEHSRSLLKYFIIKERHNSYVVERTSFGCLDYCVNCVNRNVIVYSAIYGTCFRGSVNSAHILVKTNANYLFEVSNTLHQTIYVLKCSAVVGAMFVFFYYCQLLLVPGQVPKDFTPVFWKICWAGASMVQSFFIVYESASDTIMVCYCYDLENNKNRINFNFLPAANHKQFSHLFRNIQGKVNVNQVQPLLKSPISDCNLESEISFN